AGEALLLPNGDVPVDEVEVRIWRVAAISARRHRASRCRAEQVVRRSAPRTAVLEGEARVAACGDARARVERARGLGDVRGDPREVRVRRVDLKACRDRLESARLDALPIRNGLVDGADDASIFVLGVYGAVRPEGAACRSARNLDSS